MILYKKSDRSLDQLKSNAVLDVSDFLVAALVMVDLIIGFVGNWTFAFWFVLFFVVIFCSIHLYSLQKAKALFIESLEDHLYVIYRKYFSVKEERIKNEDVKIELFERTAGSYGRPLFLYISSRLNRNLEIELPKDTRSIMQVLNIISNENKIYLSPKELKFLDKHQKQLAWNKSTKGKISNSLIAAFFVILIILVFYYAFTKNP
jgi:hypothetical protein